MRCGLAEHRSDNCELGQFAFDQKDELLRCREGQKFWTCHDHELALLRQSGCYDCVSRATIGGSASNAVHCHKDTEREASLAKLTIKPRDLNASYRN